MKRILVFISMLLCLTAIADDRVKCNQGDQNPPNNNDSIRLPGDKGTITQLPSSDPNDLIGPEGYDSVRWVSINDVLNYTIRFENDPDFALANAQYVDVRFDFWNKVAMRGFGLGTFGFANHSWPIDKSPAAYQNRLDVRDSQSIFVDLTAGVDVTKQQGFWTFNSIDPETGVNPWQTDRGMLPINDSTHVGEGFVTFTLRPQDDLKTGDTISIQASIVFDTNDTIPTNRWCNKIDAGNPESKLTAETHPTLPNIYNLKFTGKDDEGGSGIKHVLLYLANHNGIYEETDTVAVDSVLAFPVEGGKQYKLYSIAVDNTGNRESAKEEPDVILNFNQAPTDIALSDTIFQDDLAAGGYIGRLTSVDTEDNKSFTYALSEGDGAIHNDMFQITDDQLQIKQSFKCSEDSCFKVRISTTDDGGMSFSRAFTLNLEKVLEQPRPDTLVVNICEGETCLFHGAEYDQTGIYRYTKDNEFMCDSLYVLNLTVLPHQEIPLVTIEGTHTLVSSATKGNQWFKADGTPIEGAIEQKFTPEEDGIYYVAVSNGSCYSDPSQLYQVKLSDYIDLQMDLKTGWNWVSSNLSEPTHRDAKQFLQPIEDITERFVGQVDELINDPVYGLTGGLTTIAPTESYKLKVSENSDYTWSGNGSKPETTMMTLRKGWNWIGYVPVSSNDLSAALAGVTPSENDIIKCLDDFATYSGGRWVGTLTQLKPGEGYLYYAANPATFNYPAIRVFPVSTQAGARAIASLNSSPWSYDAHRYPDNTTVIGQLYANGSLALEGAYTVGAFCGNECRGIGKYADGKLFITIHGTNANGENISFKAYENVTGTEYNVLESIAFNGQQEGTFAMPYRLTVNHDATDIDGVETGKFTVYPRPLHSRLYINGETTDIKTVQMLSSDGAVNIRQVGYTDGGIDVSGLQPGVYVVAITRNNGKVYYEKVIKAQN